MSEPRAMPRPAIIVAGWTIALAAAAGLGLGMVRDLKGLGGSGADADAGEVVAPIKAANAQPLVAPPVTEADVRRWAREEMQASSAARVVRKPKAPQDGPDLDSADTAEPAAPPIVPGQPLTGNVTTPKPPTQPVQQIPF